MNSLIQPRPVVIITGCSSGLGLETAKHLQLTDKYRLVITAREKSLGRLTENFLESENLMIRPLDLLEDKKFPQLINEVCENWGRIDYLINNAGVCYRSVVEHMDEQSEYIQLKTNYLGPMNLIRSVLPIMREQKSGHIINISSVSGMLSMPTMASYSASKFALEGASEALWYEARPYGIFVTLVEPGFIRSKSYEHVLFSKKANLSVRVSGPHSEYYNSFTPFIERLMKLSLNNPTSISKKIEKVMNHKYPPLRVRVTLDAHLFYYLQKFLPQNLFRHLMFYLLPGSSRWGYTRVATRLPARRSS